jgi:hypothetical protein
VYEIPHWTLGSSVRIAQSASGVPVTTHPDDNLVRGNTFPWPAPELLQKFCASSRFRGATPEDDDAARSGLGLYCDLQSLNSEDAVTWSVFGILAYLPDLERSRIAGRLFSRIGLAPPARNVACWLWRRLPHPEKPESNNGPELDFAFLTDSAFILGEAKWNSPIGVGQGIKKDRTQLDLRLEYCQHLGRRALPGIKQFVILGVGRLPGLLPDPVPPVDGITVQNLVWEEVVECFESPLRDELSKYLQWRQKYGQQAS